MRPDKFYQPAKHVKNLEAGGANPFRAAGNTRKFSDRYLMAVWGTPNPAWILATEGCIPWQGFWGCDDSNKLSVSAVLQDPDVVPGEGLDRP